MHKIYLLILNEQLFIEIGGLESSAVHRIFFGMESGASLSISVVNFQISIREIH